MNTNRGFILIEISVGIVITLLIVCIVFSLKRLEVQSKESMKSYVEAQDEIYIRLLMERSECEIECLEEAVPQLNY